MKKIALTLVAATLIAASAFKSFAQTQQTRQVSGFTGISSSNSFTVHVKIDGTESLKISADEKTINDIETVVENGTLKIGLKREFSWSHRDFGKVDVYVTAKSLSMLSNSGSGSITLDGVLDGNDVQIHISGSGNITSAVKAGALAVHISGSGSVNLAGTSNDADVHISGSGQLRAKDFKTDELTVGLSGSGIAHITAEKKISGHISGSGSLVYSGNPTEVDVRSSGSGRVRKG